MNQPFTAHVEEHEDAFAQFDTDNQTDSLSDNKPDEETPAAGDVPAEDNVPFHKHPRWIERENELNELKERDEQMARELAELKALKNSSPADSDIPPWFSELYGDNQVAWSKYAEHEHNRTVEIENRILARQQESQLKEAQEVEHWNKWVDSEITKLQSDGSTFDRNKLIKVMLDYSPTDANNNLDFQKGLAIYEALEGKSDTAKADARKQLADTATSTSTRGEPTKKDYMTPAELRNRSWGSLT